MSCNLHRIDLLGISYTYKAKKVIDVQAVLATATKHITSSFEAGIKTGAARDAAVVPCTDCKQYQSQ